MNYFYGFTVNDSLASPSHFIGKDLFSIMLPSQTLDNLIQGLSPHPRAQRSTLLEKFGRTFCSCMSGLFVSLINLEAHSCPQGLLLAQIEGSHLCPDGHGGTHPRAV